MFINKDYKQLKNIAFRKGRFVIRMLKALEKLHNLGYVHCDIKMANFCFPLELNNKLIIYLIDFGLTMKANSCEKFSIKGTLPFISPYVIINHGYNFVDDLISLLYSIVSTIIGLPWEKQTDFDIIQKMKLSYSFFSLAISTKIPYLLKLGSYIDWFVSKGLQNHDNQIQYSHLYWKLKSA